MIKKEHQDLFGIFLIIGFCTLYLSINQIAYATNTLTATGTLGANVVSIQDPVLEMTNTGETNLVDKVKLYVNGSLNESYDFNPDVSSPPNVPTTLTHTFTKTINYSTTFNAEATGSRYIYDNVTHNYDDAIATGWHEKLWAEKFEGLPSGQDINAVRLYVSEHHGSVRVKLYEDNPCYDGGEFCDNGVIRENIQDYSTEHVSGKIGKIYAQKFDLTYLESLNTFDPASVRIQSLTINTGNAIGLVVAQIYASDGTGGNAGTLIAESQAYNLTNIGTTGEHEFTFNTYLDGSTNKILWFAVQFNSNTTSILQQSGLASGTQIYATQTFPTLSPNCTNSPPQDTCVVSDDPDPFPSATDGTTGFYMKVKALMETNGSPTGLLAETSSITLTSDGFVDIPISTTIPNNGIVWASFQTTSSTLALYYSPDQAQGTVEAYPEPYSAGPDPFGIQTDDFCAAGHSSCPHMIDLDSPPWMEVRFLADVEPFTVMSNTLTFNPVYTPSYGWFCGITRCSHDLNFTYFRSDDFTKLTLIVNRLPVPFNIECQITNGTFNQQSAWHNYSNVGVFNSTFNVPPRDNAYGICFGSGPLLTFTSYGNQSAIVTGAGFFDASIGSMIGVPAGVFFIVMAASLANARTGPIWVVIILAIIGIVSTIGFFTLSAGVWAMALIIGMLGLLVGKKVF